MENNMRRLLVIGGAVVAIVVAALAGLYVLGGRGPNGQPNGSLLARLENGLSTITSGLSPPKTATAGEGETFAFRRLEVDTTKPQAEACLVFTRDLDASGKTHYVTLKTGLPDAAGDKLIEDETVPVELRDKPGVVRFSGGIVLPRDTAQGVPVTTVNISKLRVKLIRVGDRLLSQIESGVVDQTSLYGWD